MERGELASTQTAAESGSQNTGDIGCVPNCMLFSFYFLLLLVVREAATLINDTSLHTVASNRELQVVPLITHP